MQLPNTENELWLVAPLLSRSFNLIRHGGGGGVGAHCAAADSFACSGSIRDLGKVKFFFKNVVFKG